MDIDLLIEPAQVDISARSRASDDVRSAPVVDMSPAAIERRLAEVGALYPLMLSLRAAAVEPTSDAVQGVARPSAPTG